MWSKFTYLFIDIGALLVPFIFSFHKKINFNKQWKAFLPANSIIALVFIIWDALYTYLGVWGFNDKYILGIRLFGLPIEEILFFICIPYSSIFTYYCFKLFFPLYLKNVTLIISSILVVFLFLVGFLNITHLYTGATFIALAFFIFYFSFVKKQAWLNTFYLMYLVILLPFFIINGMLTGTGLDEPVVWYNNNENLNSRIFTIPVEDVFYGILLLLLNTALFEKFKTKKV